MSGRLFVEPARGQIVGRRERFVDDRAVADLGPDDAVAIALQQADERAQTGAIDDLRGPLGNLRRDAV